jgi:hypothetical protein
LANISLVSSCSAKRLPKIGRPGQQRAAAIDQKDRGAGALRRVRRKLAEPMQIDRCDDDSGNGAAVLDDRKNRHHSGSAADPADQIIAQRKITRAQSILKIRSIGHIQSLRGRIAGALDTAIDAGDGEPADPRHTAGQILECLVAVGRLERRFGVKARRNAEQGAGRIDDLALRRDAAARLVNDLSAGELSAFDAGTFEAADAFDHQRSDCDKGDDNQPGANAEEKPVTTWGRRRRLGQYLQQCLRYRFWRRCVNFRHSAIPRPRFHNLENVRKNHLRSSVKI